MTLEKMYDFYGLIMKLMGYERSISRYITNLPITVNKNCSILDVGCGTGIVGLALLRKFAGSTLLATDLEKNFLHQLPHNAKTFRVDLARVSTGLSDISFPEQVVLTDDSSINLEEKKFDIVSASGAIGYSKNLERTLRTLLRLVKPSGYFINLEMKESLMGRFVSKKYHYSNMPLRTMIKIIQDEGFSIKKFPLGMNYFPVNITRTSIIAQKV